METKQKKEQTKEGHEHYLRHLLLLGHAVPLLLRDIVKRAVENRKQKLENVLQDTKFTFKVLFLRQYLKLFPEGNVNTDLMSWDTRLLCIVICIAFVSDLSETDCDAIECIMEQLNDFENYAETTSLDYDTYETKLNNLQKALLDLLTTADSKTKFECARLIQQYAKERITVNTRLTEKLKRTKDLVEQMQIAIDHNDQNVDGEIKSDDEEDRTYKTETPVKFIENLTDAKVIEGEDITFTCKVETLRTHVWFHDGNEIKTSDVRRKLFSTQNEHKLTILNVKLYDEGEYKIAFGNRSSEAILTVTETPVKFIENLTDAKVIEGDDITLTCYVETLRTPVVWFHDDQEIKTSDMRRKFSSTQNEHKLTILNVKLYDEGEYKIAIGDKSSEAILTVTGNTTALRMQLTKQNYRNWVRGTLSLLYLKEGLVEFSNKCVIKQHGIFISSVSASATPCTQCSVDTLMPSSNHANNKPCHKRNCLCSKKPKLPHKRTVCPNGGFCSRLYDLILADHRNADPCLANTDIPAWTKDPWSIGTCFVNTPGYRNRKSAQEIDCSGLLSVFINNVFFNTELGDVRINGQSDLFKQARDARNDILHNPNNELSISELHRYVNLFTAVLEISNAANKKPLENEIGTTEALENLKRLQNCQIDIDEEVNRSNVTASDQDIKDKLEQAKKDMEERIKQLEETMKEKEDQIKFLRQVRSCQPTKETAKFEVAFDMTIVITGSSKVRQYHDKILGASLNPTQSTESVKPQNSSLDEAVETLVYSMVEIPEVGVSIADGSALSLRICVSSYDGMNGFINLTNGQLFQQNVYQLRKYIEKEIGESVLVDACVTSKSLTDAKDQLSTNGILYDTHGNFTCKNHSWMQNVWYCVEHVEFCCTMCKNTEHRSCKSMEKIKSDSEVEKSLFEVQEKYEYNVRKTDKSARDKQNCLIVGICALPNDGILLVDSNNNRLKKLDSSYKLISHCDLPLEPLDLCYIGNDVAVVSLRGSSMQLIDLSGNMQPIQNINLSVRCSGLACHGDILYMTSNGSVCTCKTDGTQERVQYRSQGAGLFMSIAVNDDGEKIYIAAGNKGIVAIDNEGNHLSTLKTDGINYVKNVCTVGDGTVLVYDSSKHCIVQVDYEGKRVLGTVVSDGLKTARSLCYDRKHCRLIVGHCDKISVFKLK